MTAASTHAIVIERYLDHPPEKVWRALTEGPLLEQWLMPGDFRAEVGHRFTFRSNPAPNWSGVTEGEVLEVQPCKRLVYCWHTVGAPADALYTTVTWTLTPTRTGALLRLEQSGFRPEQESNFRVATRAWGRFVRRLGEVLASLPDRPG